MNSLPRWFSRKGKKKKIEGGLDHDKHSLYSNVRKLIVILKSDFDELVS